MHENMSEHVLVPLFTTIEIETNIVCESIGESAEFGQTKNWKKKETKRYWFE